MSPTEWGIENHADLLEAVLAPRVATRVAEGAEDHRSHLAAIPRPAVQEAVGLPRLEVVVAVTTGPVRIR